MNKHEIAWVMAEGLPWDKKRDLLPPPLNQGIDHIMDFTDVDNIKKSGNVKIISIWTIQISS